jgi:hypothetical protein
MSRDIENTARNSLNGTNIPSYSSVEQLSNSVANMDQQIYAKVISTPSIIKKWNEEAR